MLQELQHELVQHLLQSLDLRARLAVLCTCSNSRDAVLASKDALLAGCEPPTGGLFSRDLGPATIENGFLLLIRRKREIQLQPGRPHLVSGSLKNVWVVGGGAASLARGGRSDVGQPTVLPEGTRWLGRNHICGVRLDRVDVAGWTTLVGCHVVDGIKVSAGATVELLGCIIDTHYPHSLRVGKGSKLTATDCHFRTVPSSHEASRARFTEGEQWTDVRASPPSQAPLYHVRAQRSRAVILRNCTLDAISRGVCISIELGKALGAMEKIVLEDCDVGGDSALHLLRGDLPRKDAVQIRRNRFGGRVFVNNDVGTELVLEHNQFEDSGVAVEAVNGVRVCILGSELEPKQCSAMAGSSFEVLQL